MAVALVECYSESMLKLPTKEEVLQSINGAFEDGPIPLAHIVDTNEGLRCGFMAMTDQLREVPRSQLITMAYMFLKSAFVQGLNMGIRIGEARGANKENHIGTR